MKNVDHKGKRIFSGDEYFIFENSNGYEAVHCEDLEEYLINQCLFFDNYEEMVEYVENELGVYPETYL